MINLSTDNGNENNGDDNDTEDDDDEDDDDDDDDDDGDDDDYDVSPLIIFKPSSILIEECFSFCSESDIQTDLFLIKSIG